MKLHAGGKLRAPLQALRWTLVAVVVHAAMIALYVYVDRLIPHRTIEREVEVTWIERPTTDPNITLPPAPPEAPPMTPVPPPPMMAQAPPPPIPPPPAPQSLPVPPPQQQQPKPPEPKKPDIKKPEQKPAELALIPKPVDPKKPEEAPPPEPPKQPQAQLKVERIKKVEVDDDKNVVNEPPPEAAYLSDKNRRVKEETRDTRTNLDKMSKGDANASDKSEDRESEEVGGEEEQIRQLEKAQATNLEKKRLEETRDTGKHDEAKGVLSGDKATGAAGEGGKGGENGQPGALAMRNVEGRGAPGMARSMSVAPAGVNDDAPAVSMSENPGKSGDQGPSGRQGRAGKAGKRGPKLQLTMDDYQRAMGADAIRDEAEIARRMKSHKKGRWEKKLDRIHAALENFTPEVKPGNQTALGTRAAPFAVFVARMHRQIHELWGFGFLEDLDGKSPGHEMNKRDLKVKLEIVLNADGTVDRATIVNPSGNLPFDVAAIDTIENAGPFEEPPQEIVSANGKIYLHWTFHRDERQCSPYFADPFILDTPPAPGMERGLPNPGDGVARNRRQPEQLKRNASPTEGGVTVPRLTRTADAEAAAARATINTPSPDDPAAQDVAIKWGDAFESGRLDRLTEISSVPFSSAGTVVATDPTGVAKVWRNLLDESPTRDIKEWKVLSPAGYRAVFGRLPKGAGDDTTGKLYVVAKLGRDWISLDLTRDAGGVYRIQGVTR